MKNQQNQSSKFKRFNKIADDIKKVKIQGAENVAKAAVSALVFKHDKQAIKKLLSLRPTEPCLRNSIKFVLWNTQNGIPIEKAINLARKHFENATRTIARIGSKLIKHNMRIFTHCHSQTVMDILIEAKKQGKQFEVWQTETRPLFQGRITAKQLAKAGIKVTHFVDSASRLALKKADIMLVGCDAITTTRVYNKIGSEMFAIIANKYDVPVYVATDSWKFDPEAIYGTETAIEERSSTEVWPNAPKGIKIFNPAFEKIDAKLITAIISELGIFMKKSFIQEVKNAYPFMFRKMNI
jgi:ribose 1,5-bisphosphate isomerase